jgi:hypothetical protein
MATIINNDNGTITVSITIALQGSLMDMENTILDATNEIGCLATAADLKRFDSDGSPIRERTLSGPRKGKMPRNIKPLTEWQKSNAMFIKPHKADAFIVH